MASTKSKIVAKAHCDTQYEGCNGLEDHDNAKWFELGGVDIVVWGNDWTIYADNQSAIDYVAGVYDLSCLEVM